MEREIKIVMSSAETTVTVEMDDEVVATGSVAHTTLGWDVRLDWTNGTIQTARKLSFKTALLTLVELASNAPD